MEFLDQLRVPVNIGFELFRPIEQLCADGMLAEPLANDVVIGTEEVLANVTQEVEMADEVWHPGKDYGYGLEDPRAHVVNQCQGNSEGLLDALEKRHDVFLVLGRQLDVAKHNIGKRIDGSHQ